MVVAVGDDFSSYGMVAGDVDSLIIVEDSVDFLDAAFVVQGIRDLLVPLGGVVDSALDALQGFIDSGHDECPEVFGFKDDDFLIIVLSLVVVCMAREEVCLSVCRAGEMMEGEMVFG